MRLHLLLLSFLLIASTTISFAQNFEMKRWADSVFESLSDDERIAQLLVIRSSGMDGSGNGVLYDKTIDTLVSRYNIGAICAFQGTPLQHAAMFNRMQSMAKTPVMITVDAEWGLGMRFAGVKSFPYQLTLGAVPDAALIYNVGKAIADQCRRMNIHVNYAPVVDINNNPDNPVIGVRSFGEDKYKVALMGTRMMQAFQDNGVMACAKHFPGHGDVAVDSHLDLPVINKSMAALDTLELYPFKQLFAQGVASVMVAHLYIPAIDTTPNQATSLSYQNITGLMRTQLGYNGLTFTDALEMKGVTKFYPGGEASVQSLIAGNDMLCLPENVPQTIDAVKKAIAEGRLSWNDVYTKCKRVLLAKFLYVNGKTGEIGTSNLLEDLNKDVLPLRKQVAENALTVLRMREDFLPLRTYVSQGNESSNRSGILYISFGGSDDDALAARLQKSFNADVISLPLRDASRINTFKVSGIKRYRKIIIGLHGVTRSPANNFGVSQAAIDLINKIQQQEEDALLLTFGNPYVNKFFGESQQLVACYEDDSVFQNAAADWLMQRFDAQGTLPVTVGPFPFGSGIVKKKTFEAATPDAVQMHGEMLAGIDDIANEAIAKKATPGCVVTVVRKGKLVFSKSYGTLTYDNPAPVTTETIYDLASVTKIAATTVSLMKLIDEGKINLHHRIASYLPWLNESDKAGLTVENLMMHQAGLNPFIPFYREVTDNRGNPVPDLISPLYSYPFTTTVTGDKYLRSDWNDTMYRRIRDSRLDMNGIKYVYSDNDFILLGKIVEAVSGKSLDEYARDNFYVPLGMRSTTFKPSQHFPLDRIAPTEHEQQFRNELIWGYVHDPGAAMFGNVAGHAGLFSDGTDLARLFQMLLNGGEFNKRRYIKKETIDWFTSYQTPISRRGLGFDKPEKDNEFKTEDKTYPTKLASPLAYGHTGFTGICVWVDPQYDLIYIFLSNRVNPTSDNPRLVQLNIRSRIQELIYKSIIE